VADIDYDIVHRIFRVQVRREPAIEKLEEQGIEVHPQAKLSGDGQLPVANEPKKSNGATFQTPVERDPNQMTDDELDTEIARLEAIEKSSQSTVNTSQSATTNPYNSISNKPIKVDKIGRNDPCPCGSGLKWKKCGLVNSPKHKG